MHKKQKTKKTKKKTEKQVPGALPHVSKYKRFQQPNYPACCTWGLHYVPLLCAAVTADVVKSEEQVMLFMKLCGQLDFYLQYKNTPTIWLLKEKKTENEKENLKYEKISVKNYQYLQYLTTFYMGLKHNPK